MGIRTVRTSRGELTIRTGSEGPSHDPYSYTEYVAKDSRGRTVVLHQGLAEYLKVGTEKLMEFADPDLMERKFEELTGLHPTEVEDAYNRRPLRCCEKPRIEEVSGHPGESFLMCQNCGKIFETHFHPSQIE